MLIMRTYGSSKHTAEFIMHKIFAPPNQSSQSWRIAARMLHVAPPIALYFRSNETPGECHSMLCLNHTHMQTSIQDDSSTTNGARICFVV